MAFLKFEETRDHFLHVIPVAGIICLNEKRSARRQSAMDQDEKFRSHEPTSDLTRIEVRLRMVTVNLSHAARRDMIPHEFRGVAHRESEVAEAALVASSCGVANHHGQNVQTEMIVRRPPNRTADGESSVAASQV